MSTHVMKSFLLLAFMLFESNIFSQEVLLDMEVEDQYQETDGPNMQNFSYVYIGLGANPRFRRGGDYFH